MKQFGILAVTLLLWATAARAAEPAPLILISIDGFRADYLDRGQTPTLAMLAQTGVRAIAMHPSFPSITYPNHYTLVTGLYPDHSGVVDNVMWDPAISAEKFTMDAKTAEDPRWWDGATPLWVSAQIQGRIVASAGWPGSEGLIHDHRANYLDGWREKRMPAEIAAVTLNWFDLPMTLRPSLALLYFDDVDHDGHDFGPDSPQVNTAMHRVDAALGQLVAGLKARHLFDQTNIVIVSDHGMAATANARSTVLDQLVTPADGIVRSTGASGGIDALPGHENRVAAILLAPHLHFTCWRKADIPAHLHYGRNPRVPQFVCLNEDGWRFTTIADKAKWTKEHPGGHGYDPADPHMDALFLAHGPGFRRGVTLPAFDNVDVYPLLAAITGIKPEKNDGRLSDIAAALSR